MFQFSAFAFRLSGMPCLLHGGLPHSETRGSIRVCRSPRFIAACRVLPRLWEPRHPPCALLYFLPGAPLLLGAPAPGPGNMIPGPPLSSLVSSFSQYVNELSAKPCSGNANVENNGFEPLTPCVQGRCSSQLS